jgi:predicted aspartyl protease
MKKYILFLILLFPFFFICQNSNKKEETVLVIPSDTIPMQYSNENLLYRYCLPILNGIVNDSLHFDVFFDTGSTGNHFCIPESFKNLFDSDSAFVQIGKFKKQMGIRYWGSSQSSIISILGNNTIMVGWQFFENRIIEFDFQNQRILVYDELPDITEYSKTKITLFQYFKLLIPAQVVIQGKTIKSDSLLIDTGFNGYMEISYKHIEEQGIDTTNAYFNIKAVSGGLRHYFSISADTIKIGDLYVANQNTRISFHDYTGDFGLLGTKTLENFSVILDLINYDLYLKKNDE